MGQVVCTTSWVAQLQTYPNLTSYGMKICRFTCTFSRIMSHVDCMPNLDRSDQAPLICDWLPSFNRYWIGPSPQVWDGKRSKCSSGLIGNTIGWPNLNGPCDRVPHEAIGPPVQNFAIKQFSNPIFAMSFGTRYFTFLPKHFLVMLLNCFRPRPTRIRSSISWLI